MRSAKGSSSEQVEISLLGRSSRVEITLKHHLSRPVKLSNVKPDDMIERANLEFFREAQVELK